MKLSSVLTVLALGALALTGCSSSGPDEQAEIPNRPSSGNILDEADILTDAQEQELNQLIDRKNEQTDAARLVIHTYDEDRGEVKDYSAQVGNAWKVGDNNGVLISVDMENREVYIAVSDESSITDNQAETVVENSIEPSFKSDQYYDGLHQATEDLYTYAQGNTPENIAQAEKDDSLIGWAIGGCCAVMALIMGLWTWLERRKWNRIADTEIEQALAQDPTLDVTDEMRKAYRSYRRNHRTPPVEGAEEYNDKLREQEQEDEAEYTYYAGSFSSWLPFYLASPALYSGAGNTPDRTTGSSYGSASGSSFGGGSTFSGGGAGGRF